MLTLTSNNLPPHSSILAKHCINLSYQQSLIGPRCRRGSHGMNGLAEFASLILQEPMHQGGHGIPRFRRIQQVIKKLQHITFRKIRTPGGFKNGNKCHLFHILAFFALYGFKPFFCQVSQGFQQRLILLTISCITIRPCLPVGCTVGNSVSEYFYGHLCLVP